MIGKIDWRLSNPFTMSFPSHPIGVFMGCWLLIFLIVFAPFALGRIALSQEVEFDVEFDVELEAEWDIDLDVGFVQFVQPGFNDDTFDQWVFQNDRTSQKARQRMNASLSLRSEDILRACDLSDAQKNNLHLAGQGDIKRFFDNYEKIKKKFQLIKNDQQKINQIWQDISPLQMKLQAGLFNHNSIYHKSLHNTLTAEQLAKYEVVASERLAFHRRASIEMTVFRFEEAVPLRAKQREKLVSLLINKTKPPKISSPYDYYVILYQLSLHEEELKTLLDGMQWKVIDRQLTQSKAMLPMLRQSGHLPEEDE